MCIMGLQLCYVIIFLLRTSRLFVLNHKAIPFWPPSWLKYALAQASPYDLLRAAHPFCSMICMALLATLAATAASAQETSELQAHSDVLW